MARLDNVIRECKRKMAAVRRSADMQHGQLQAVYRKVCRAGYDWNKLEPLTADELAAIESSLHFVVTDSLLRSLTKGSR